MCSRDHQSDSSTSDGEFSPATGQRRLWTPWRMKYIGAEAGEPGCIFCNRLAANNDVESLIVYRGTHAFIIMNLYPYNTGHVMIVPNRHVADLEALSEAELTEMGRLAPVATSALRQVLRPTGFNLGMNIGALAGAGVADHLHQHVVPRWQGDANFMPIIAGTVVVPELIPDTYAKIRMEFERPASGFISLIILTADANHVLVLESNTLPKIEIEPDEPIFRTAVHRAKSLVGDVSLVGWAGPARAGEAGQLGLAFLSIAPSQLPQGAHWNETADSMNRFEDPRDQRVLANALKLDFTIAAAPPG
jgi:ATP adenylyltransferase